MNSRRFNLLSILFIGMLSTLRVNGQELFNYAEPASNMPAKSLGLRLTNNIFNEKHLKTTTNQFLPELMWGINKKWMLHIEGILNNSGHPFRPMGLSVYSKYRFLTVDNVYRHFRMAAFARLSSNRGHLHYQEIETNGMNSGIEMGIVTTQLLHKQALSLTLAFEQIGNNAYGNELHLGNARNAFNYSFSTGRLILPRAYTSYKQTNFNVMLEFLGQYQAATQLHYFDVAPSIQFIVNSQTRIDFGYRRQLAGNKTRMATESVMLRVEHLLFNAL